MFQSEYEWGSARENSLFAILFGVKINTRKLHDVKVMMILKIAKDQRSNFLSQLASSLILAARDLTVHGLFLRVDRPFIDNPRFEFFFKVRRNSTEGWFPLLCLLHSSEYVGYAKVSRSFMPHWALDCVTTVPISSKPILPGSHYRI